MNQILATETKKKKKSINILDIQDTLDVNKWDYHNYETATKTKYGQLFHIDASKTYYPYQWTLEANSNNKIDEVKIEGTLGNSEQTELTEQNAIKAENSIDIEQTEWRRKMEKTDFIDEIYYQLFINDTANYSRYWLASRSVYSSGSNSARIWNRLYTIWMGR